MTGRLAACLLIAVLMAACGQDAPDGAPDPDVVAVELFFTNDQLGDPCGEVFPVEREVAAADPVRGALEALLAGPSAAEREEGYGGWFSGETAGLLTSLQVDGGTARADFAGIDQVIPNASTSCGSGALLAELDTTLLQFEEVDTTVYALDGDVDAFYEWLQLSGPGEVGAARPIRAPTTSLVHAR